MAILDGKYIDNEQIDPAKHKFIGTFRTPAPPYAPFPVDGYECPCGELLLVGGNLEKHWREGHYDMPQYQTIP